MKRNRLGNKFLNTKSDIDRKAYNTQRNLYVSLIRQAKKQLAILILAILIQMLSPKIKLFGKL